MNILKKSDVQHMLPRRDPNSHKGQNGRVLIIGGSIDFSGAPVLAGLGALNSGTDLVTLLVPECNFDVSRSFYPDFIVQKYQGNYINTNTLDAATPLLPHADCVLIGPGVTEDPEILRVITRIIQKTACHIILDAEAIPAISHLELLSGANDLASRIVITPHRGEMDEILEQTLPEDLLEEMTLVEDFVKKWGVTVLLKGPRDVIAAPGKPTRVNETGNAGMTVGGSGDVLAGCVASLIAQHAEPYEACLCAAFLSGTAGDNLFRVKGNNFIATDIALELPYTIKNITG